MKTKKYLLETYEIPLIASKLKESLKRDLYDFREFSVAFTDDFLMDFEDLINHASMVPNTKVEVDIKMLEQLEYLLKDMSLYIKLIEHDAQRLMLELIYEDIKSVDLISLSGRLGDLIKSFQKHEYLFVNFPIDPANIIQLEAYYNYVKKISQENGLTPINEDVLYEMLWNYMKEICIVGQKLYRCMDRARAKDYSFKELKSKWLVKNMNCTVA